MFVARKLSVREGENVKNFVAILALCSSVGLSAAYSADTVSSPAILSLLASPSENVREFTFTAAADGTGLSYHWNFGDGSEASGEASATHAFAADGTYSVSVSVSDGASESEPQFVSVRAATDRQTFLVNNPIITKKKFSITFLKPQSNTLNFAYQSTFIAFPSLLSFTSKFTNALVTVYIGNAQIDSIILTKTKGKGYGSVSFNYKKGIVEYKSKGLLNMLDLMAPFGVANATGVATIGVPLEIDINNGVDVIGIFTTVPFTYTAKFDKKGTGK